MRLVPGHNRTWDFPSDVQEIDPPYGDFESVDGSSTRLYVEDKTSVDAGGAYIREERLADERLRILIS